MEKKSLDGLCGKVCVITGGAGIIGSSIAGALAQQGVKMVLIDLFPDKAEQTARNIEKETGTPCLGVGANILKEEELNAVHKKITDQWGPVDMLINCAGGNRPNATTSELFLTRDNALKQGATFITLAMAGFRDVLDLNFLGTVMPTQVFSQDMITKGKGVILNISSMNAIRPLTRIPAYSAAKAAVNNFTQWLAVHFAKANIRVNAIAPGFLLTDQNRFLLTDKETGKLTPRGESIIAHTPMGELGKPEDLHGAVLYLMSDLSRFVTGIVIPVDGGFSAYSGV